MKPTIGIGSFYRSHFILCAITLSDSVAPLCERRLGSEAVYKEVVTSGPRKLGDLMQALLRS